MRRLLLFVFSGFFGRFCGCSEKIKVLFLLVWKVVFLLKEMMMSVDLDIFMVLNIDLMFIV